MTSSSSPTVSGAGPLGPVGIVRPHPSRPRPRRRSAAGFTLVELLVVIGIIGVLVSILLPALSRAREQGQRTACMSNLRQICTAIVMYEQDHKSLPGHVYPCAIDPRNVDAPDGTPLLTAADAAKIISNQRFLPSYLNHSREVWFCPASTDIRQSAMPSSTSSAYAGKVLGYSYRFNNQPTNYPPYFFGNWNTGASADTKRPKKTNQVIGVDSDDMPKRKLSLTEVWMISDLDARNFPAGVSNNFGLDSSSTAFDKRKWQPAHTGVKVPGRNFAFFDTHVEFRSLSDNVYDP